MVGLFSQLLLIFHSIDPLVLPHSTNRFPCINFTQHGFCEVYTSKLHSFFYYSDSHNPELAYHAPNL